MNPEEGGTKLSPAIEEDKRIVDEVEFKEPQYNKRNEGGLEPLYERGKRVKNSGFLNGKNFKCSFCDFRLCARACLVTD